MPRPEPLITNFMGLRLNDLPVSDVLLAFEYLRETDNYGVLVGYRHDPQRQIEIFRYFQELAYAATEEA